MMGYLPTDTPIIFLRSHNPQNKFDFLLNSILLFSSSQLCWIYIKKELRKYDSEIVLLLKFRFKSSIEKFLILR